MEEFKSIINNKVFWPILLTIISFAFFLGKCSRDSEKFRQEQEIAQLKEQLNKNSNKILVFDTIKIYKLLPTNKYYRGYHYQKENSFKEAFVDPYTGASLSIHKPIFKRNEYYRSSTAYNESESEFIGIVNIKGTKTTKSIIDTIYLGQFWTFYSDSTKYKLIFDKVDTKKKSFSSQVIQIDN